MTTPRRDLAGILTLILSVNLVTAFATSGWTTAAVQVGAALLAVAAARWRGYTADQLALSRARMVDGARLGFVVVIGVAACVAAVVAVPPTREFFSDDRFANLSIGAAIYETVVRIPVFTALTEELLFRSVLLGVLLVSMSTRVAICVSAVVFGLWHIVTTLDDLGENDVTESLGTWGRVGGVAATVVATGIAGVLFSWLRVRSTSIVAPWMAHVAFNSSAFLAGFLVTRYGWL